MEQDDLADHRNIFGDTGMRILDIGTIQDVEGDLHTVHVVFIQVFSGSPFYFFLQFFWCYGATYKFVFHATSSVILAIFRSKMWAEDAVGARRVTANSPGS